MSAEARVKELGLEIPPPFKPAGQYVNAVRSSNLLFLAGHLPYKADGSIVLGKLGDDMDVNAGYEAGKLAALGALATIREELGSLDKVTRIVRGVRRGELDAGLHAAHAGD